MSLPGKRSAPAARRSSSSRPRDAYGQLPRKNRGNFRPYPINFRIAGQLPQLPIGPIHSPAGSKCRRARRGSRFARRRARPVPPAGPASVRPALRPLSARRRLARSRPVLPVPAGRSILAFAGRPPQAAPPRGDRPSAVRAFGSAPAPVESRNRPALPASAALAADAQGGAGLRRRHYEGAQRGDRKTAPPVSGDFGTGRPSVLQPHAGARA